MDGDDFLNSFMGVDILKVEGAGEIIGRAHAALFKGMTEAGLGEAQAVAIVGGMHREFFRAAFVEISRSNRAD